MEVVIARATTPEGHDIALLAIRWAKIIEGHPEMVEYLEEILHTVSDPDHREPDTIVGRERMFRRVDPSGGYGSSSMSNRSSRPSRRPTILSRA